MKNVHIELHVFVDGKEKVITVQGIMPPDGITLKADSLGLMAMKIGVAAATERAFMKLTDMEAHDGAAE